MSANLTSYGISQTYVNGEKVSDISYDAKYNGDHIDIATYNGTTKSFTRLSNNEIEDLLNNVESKKSLHDKILSHSKSRSRTKSHKKSLSRSRTKSHKNSLSKPTHHKKTHIKSSRKSKTKKARKRHRKKKRSITRKRTMKPIDSEVIW